MSGDMGMWASWSGPACFRARHFVAGRGAVGGVNDRPNESGADSKRGDEILRPGRKRPVALPSQLLPAHCRAVPLPGERMETGRTAGKFCFVVG
jgi:hypothetical protein